MPGAAGTERHARVVVGAGMSGLAYAWWCHARGEDVVLVEAADRVGGVIRTIERDGYRFERAATTIPSSARNLRALLASLPAPPPLLPAREAAQRPFILRRGGLAESPRSPRSLLRGDALLPRHALRALGEVLRGPRRRVGGESLHRFVRRRFGHGVAEGFLRPFTTGIYGASPERLGAADAFPRLAALERRRGSVIKGLVAGRGGGKRRVLVAEHGTESIVRAVADALGPRVRLGCAVEGLTPAAPGRPAAVRLAGGRTLEADEVVLAVPARRQAALLRDAHPHLADELDAIRYTPIAVAAVGFDGARGPRVPDGFGFLRGPGARTRILGATFNARMNPRVAPEGHELLTVFLGGTEDPGVLDLDDAALRSIVTRDLHAAFGAPVEPDLFDVWRWPRAIPVPAPGHRGRMARAAAQLDAGRVRLLGSHVTGVSLDDCCRPLAPLPGPLPEGLLRV